MRKLLSAFFILALASMAASSAAAQDKRDGLIVTVKLESGQVSIVSVTQGVLPAGEKYPVASGDYRLELWHSGKKIAEHKFDFPLGEMEVLPSDSAQAPVHTKATSATQHLVMLLAVSGGSRDQYVFKVFKGGSEILATSLDKLPFEREAGIAEPIRSQSEIELLKKTAFSAKDSEPPQPTPGNLGQDLGLSWGFIILATITLGAVAAGVWYYKKRQGQDDAD